VLSILLSLIAEQFQVLEPPNRARVISPSGAFLGPGREIFCSPSTLGLWPIRDTDLGDAGGFMTASLESESSFGLSTISTTLATTGTRKALLQFGLEN